MNAVVQTINATGRSFVHFALPMLIQSSVLILILLLVDLLLRRKVRAVVRYWIWMLVLLKLVLPPSLRSPISFGTWFGQTLEAPTAALYEAPPSPVPEPENGPQPQATRSPEPAEWVGDGAPATNPIVESFVPKAAPPVGRADTEQAPAPAAPQPEAPPVAATTETDVASSSPTPPAPALSWQALILLAWTAVALTLLLLLLQRATFVRGLVAQAQEAPLRLRDTLAECQQRAGLALQIALRLSPNATSPAVCGLLHPTILIPKSLTPRLEPHDLRAVLLHELAHVKRGDLWINLIQTLLQIVYFYNPLFWLANVLIRRVREQAVDEAVLVAMGETARDYPETLLNVAKIAFRRRPALSLRLIGVVESKSALSGRVKHILGRPFPKTARLGLFGLVTLFVVAAFLLPMAHAMPPKPSVINQGPLDIRLVGVCPDGGDQLYDAAGSKLGATREPHRFSPVVWSNESQCREFIFEVPDIDGQLLFLPFSPICPTGTDRRIGGTFRHFFDPMSDPHTLIESFTFDRTYRKPWAGLIRRRVPIRAVDLTLRYFYGPRRDAICTFTGPFTEGTVVQADEERPYELTPISIDSISVSQIKFRFTTNQPFRDIDVPVVVYDRQGRRHLLRDTGGHGGNQGAHLTYHGEVVPWEEIAAITIGETPHEIEFRNIVVDYPKQPRRTYPAYRDQMAQRLNLTGLSAEELAQYQYQNAQEVIAVLDLLRGSTEIRFALQTMDVTQPRVDLAALDAATRDKIRAVAASWLRSSDVQVRAYGVELGLKAGWAEFVDPALALLENPHPTELYRTRTIHHTVLNGLVFYKSITAADIERLKQFARRCDIGRVWDRLCRSYLRVSHHPAAMDALWELAQDDRPALWWPALWALLDMRDERVLASDLPETMKLRVILVSLIEQPDEAELAPKAAALLPDIFTVETLRLCPAQCYEMHRAVTTYLDRKAATALYMDFLAAALPASVQRRFEADHGSSSYLYGIVSSVLRDINLWYDVDLGQLGVFQPGVPNQNIRTRRPFEQAVTEALSWYRTGEHVQPAPRVLSGRVTDTNGKGIPDAKTTLKGPKVIFDERGRRSQQVVEVATLRTDTDGRFAFQDLMSARVYHLDIEAEGFARREHVGVRQLIDGRFHIDGNAENNTIVMENSARLSGRLIARDGVPLTDARLFWSSYSDHGASGDGSCRVDDQGHFTIDAVGSGHHLLEYNVRRRPSPTGEYDGVTGFCLVQVQEGQVIDDLVIDLRKSTATLEVEITDRQGRPVAVDGLSLDIPALAGEVRVRQVMSLAEVGPQNVHRFPNLPPMQGVLKVYVQGQRPKEVAVQLRAGEITRCKIELNAGSGRDTRIEPEPPRNTTATARTRVVAELSGGVTVELLGVAEHPSKGQPWWRPDGSPLQDAPQSKVGANIHPDISQETAYEFAVRVSNLPEGAAVTMKTEPEGSGWVNGSGLNDLRWLATALPNDLEACQLLCGVAPGSWETVASTAGTSPSTQSTRLGGVMFSQASEQATDGVTITVTDDILDRQSRVVAVTQNGRIVEASRQRLGAAGKARQATADFTDVALTEIAEFRFQTRPWEWRRFNNVSLRPGRQADVRVQAEPNEAHQGHDPTEADGADALPWTERGEKVMPVAEQEARRLNHAYVGTEHILLALARQETAVSTRVLANLGADLDTLRAEVDKFVRPGPEPVTRRTLPRLPRAERVMKYAQEEAKAMGHDYLGTEHFLLALTEEPNSIAAQVLANLNLTPPQIRAEVLSLVRPGNVQPERRDSKNDSVPSDNGTTSRQVFLPDLETPDANAVLDLASGQMLSAKPMERDRQHFTKLGQGDLTYDYANNKGALLCMRGARLRRRTSTGIEPLTPDVTRTSFVAYFLGDTPAQYQVTTAEGRAYKLDVVSINRDGLLAEFRGANANPVGPSRISNLPPHPDGPGGIHAELPDGSSVELVGVRELGGEGRPWWQPDGTLLPHAPCRCPSHSLHPSNGQTVYAFAVRVADLPDDVRGAVKVPSSAVQASYDVAHAEDGSFILTFWQAAAVLPQDQETCTVRCETMPGMWVEFENVSLRPGRQTNVEVHIASNEERAEADGVDGQTASRTAPSEDSAIVLPDVDHEAVMLDLASGRLVAIPRGASETNMGEAILEMGKGDLVHDGGALILVRNATSEQAEKMAGTPFSTCPIGQHFPQVLQVTTAEGHRYEITILALDQGQNCTLKVSPFPTDEGAGAGAAVVLPEWSREPIMLDLTSGRLVRVPYQRPGISFLETWQSIKELGRGDLLYDCDDGDHLLILARDAASEQAEQTSDESPRIQAHLIAPRLPDVLTVTTAEGRRFEVTILSVGDGRCALKYAPLSTDGGAGGGAPVGPEGTERPAVIAALPNGVTVELLAYSHLIPRTGLFWYDPRGQETTIPGVYEADVEGLGTILALRVQPSETRLIVQMYRGPDAQNIEKQWQLPETDIRLLALGQERNFANLRIITELTLPPVLETIVLTEENLGQLVEVNRCGIASIVDLNVGDTFGGEMMMDQMGFPSAMAADTETVEAMGLEDMSEPPVLRFSTINAPDSHRSIVALLDKEGRTYPVERIKYTSAGAICRGQLWPSKLAGLLVEAAPVHSADVRFRNISLTPMHVTEIRIEPAAERQLSWRRSDASLVREVLTNSIASYREDHGDRFPTQLEALERNHDENAFRWLLANIAYVGADKNPDDDPRTVIAYDKTLLAQGQGTYVFYSDGRLEFEGPLELRELGITASPEPSDTDTTPDAVSTVPQETGNSLVGQVLDPNGNPAAEAEVTICATEGPSRELDPQEHMVPTVGRKTRTDVQGRFHFEGPLPQRFILIASHETGLVMTSHSAFAEDPVLRLQPWPAVEHSRIIAGWLRGEDPTLTVDR